MPQLDNYLVTLGMKGQNIVLSQMDKIRKKGAELSKKKTTVNLASKKAQEAKASDIVEKAQQQKAIEKKIGAPDKKKEDIDYKKRNSEEKKRNEEDKKNNSKFGKSVDKFGNTTANAAHNMSRLDPVATISGGLGALAKIAFAGIPFAIAEAGVNTAANLSRMAKATVAERHGLTQRDVTANYYGGDIKQISRVSNEEQAALRMTVASSMGKVQKPLADAINNLLTGKESFNTAALARVSAGNWQSTGTDKGWMIQQLSDAFQGLPPSIAQKFQASLLNKFGKTEIQQAGEGEKNVQATNTLFKNQEEAQNAAIYNELAKFNKVTGKTNFQNIFELSDKLNNLQVGLVSAGASVTAALNFVATQIQKMHAKMQVGK